MSNYSNEIGRFNSFGTGFGTINGVNIDRYNLLTKENIMVVDSTLRCVRKYTNLAFENTIWVNYQPSCADKMFKGSGKMINGIYKKIGDIQQSDVEYDCVPCVKIRFKVERLDVYDPFEFKINDENGKYNWQSLRKDVPDASLHTIGSMGKICQENACKDVINHIKINYAIKIQRWFRNIQKSSKGKSKSAEQKKIEEMEAKMAEMMALMEAQNAKVAKLDAIEAKQAEMDAKRKELEEKRKAEAEDIQKQHDEWNSENGVTEIMEKIARAKALVVEKELELSAKIAENPHKVKKISTGKRLKITDPEKRAKLDKRKAQNSAKDDDNIYCPHGNGKQTGSGYAKDRATKGCRYICRSNKTMQNHLAKNCKFVNK